MPGWAGRGEGKGREGGEGGEGRERGGERARISFLCPRGKNFLFEPAGFRNAYFWHLERVRNEAFLPPMPEKYYSSPQSLTTPETPVP